MNTGGGGKGHKVFHGHTLAVEVYRHDGLGARTQCTADLVQVQCKGVGVYVHEDWSKAQQGYDFGRRHVGKGGRNDFVSGLEAQGHKGDLQGVGPVGARNGVHSLAEVGTEFAGECRHVRALNVGGLVARAEQSLVQFGLDARVLTDKVDHGYRRIERQVLGHSPQR